MHPLEYAILDSFREDPEAKSTTSLVQKTMKEEMQTVKELQEQQQEKEAKRKKAQLHRKLLYHINKLIDDELLQVKGTQGRGEKTFSLVHEGDITIRSGRKQVTIHKPTIIETPVDELEEAHAYHSENWLHKVNAIFLEPKATLDEIAEKVGKVAQEVNDSIGLLNFETMLGTGDPDMFLDKMRRQACKIILCVSIPQDPRKVLRFCRAYSQNRPTNVQIVFTINPTILQRHRETLEKIIEQFMKQTIKINFRNTSVHKAPIICGNAGPYTMSEEDWKNYRPHRTKNEGVAVIGASIILDLEKGEHLHRLAKKAAETLFLVGRNRRLKIENIKMGFMDDMIRCWNHDLERETLIEEINAAQEVVHDYSQMQERVYRACGMPVRCKIRISSAFGKLQGLSARSYKKMTVHGLNTLQETKYSEYLKRREEVARKFSVDRIRIFRHGEGSAQDIFREAAFILNSYAVPYITYDFSELRGDIKLTEFLGGER